MFKVYLVWYIYEGKYVAEDEIELCGIYKCEADAQARAAKELDETLARWNAARESHGEVLTADDLPIWFSIEERDVL